MKLFIQKDKLYEDTLQDTINRYSPTQLRYLFARLFTHGDIGTPLELFNWFSDALTADFKKNRMDEENAINVAWRMTVKSMIRKDKMLSEYSDLECYMIERGCETDNNFDLVHLRQHGLENLSKLNDDQRTSTNTSIRSPIQGFWFNKCFLN